MARDYFQRESLSQGIEDARENDLILISDLDEIPNLGGLNFESIKNNIIIFKQKMFYYKLNLLYQDFTWLGSKATKKISYPLNGLEILKEKVLFLENRYFFF